MRGHHTRPRQRLATIVSATFGALLIGILAPPIGYAATAPVRQVGAIPFMGPAAADPGARIWYESQIVVANGAEVYQIQTRNLDTLKVTHNVPLPKGAVLRNNTQPIVVNPSRAQLYAAYYDDKNVPHIAVVDGRAGKVAGDFAGLPSAPDGATRIISGLGYDAGSDSLYVASQVDTTSVLNKAASTELTLSELDGRTGAVRWSLPIDGCTAFTAQSLTVDATAIFRSAKRPEVYFSCRTGKASRTDVDAGSSYVAKLYLKPSGPPTMKLFPVPGSPSALTFATATDRMIISIGFGTTNGALVFAGAAEAFIGFVPGDTGTFGMDNQRGRLYSCVNSVGVLTSDAGVATPIPLGETYPILCDYSGAPIVVDPVRRTLFVRYSNVQGGNKWVIVRDESPAYVPEAPENPDAATANVAERTGVTESSYAMSAAGYGSRFVLVGGPRGAAENFSGPFAYQLVNGVNEGMYQGTGGVPGGPYQQDPPNIAYANREIWLGRVSEAKLDNDSAAATATGADRNDYVDSDLAALSHPTVLGNGVPGVPPATWPEKYEQTSCLSLGGTTDKPDGHRDPDVPKLACTQGKSVVANVLGPRDTVGIAGQITVGDASSDVTLTRDAKLGAVTTVVSRARNVAIGGVAHINEITVTAKTWAHGRRGSAGSSYQREFTGVRIVGGDGKPVYTCNPPADCNEYQVVQQLNSALGNRIHVELPSPDGGLRGSPGGAKAVLQRDRWEHLEQQTLNGQAADDTTMPGIEFEIVADNFGQSRLLVQLAGVAAESTYNISVLPQFGDYPDPPATSVTHTATRTGGGATGADEVSTKKVAQGTTTQTIVEKIRAGMRWAFGWHHGTPLVFVTWAMFGVPIYLGVRRRLLAHAIRGGLS